MKRMKETVPVEIKALHFCVSRSESAQPPPGMEAVPGATGAPSASQECQGLAAALCIDAGFVERYVSSHQQAELLLEVRGEAVPCVLRGAVSTLGPALPRTSPHTPRRH